MYSDMNSQIQSQKGSFLCCILSKLAGTDARQHKAPAVEGIWGADAATCKTNGKHIRFLFNLTLLWVCNVRMRGYVCFEFVFTIVQGFAWRYRGFRFFTSNECAEGVGGIHTLCGLLEKSNKRMYRTHRFGNLFEGACFQFTSS